ncbi:MAG: DUF1315 family protein [Hahellaceae bacterium]|nr:DUF1315 family protein [Hahellaceae bacterium]
MNLEQLLSSITPEIYQNLKTSVELGRWPDGRKLTKEQKALCMEAMIYFENKSGMDEPSKTGYLEFTKEKTSPCSNDSKNNPVQYVEVSAKKTK